jgi:hypothetical protein
MKQPDDNVVDGLKTSPFEILPTKARKKRRIADITAGVKSGEGDAPMATQSGNALYHVPGGGTGIGIACLDPLVLNGSQRIGIIGLPSIRLFDFQTNVCVWALANPHVANHCCRI